MNKRILVVDDEKDIRRVVQISLENFAGWKAVLAESGEEGLLKVKTNKPIDAILLDVSMPEMDGFQVFDCLRSNVATQSIPVILLTAKVLPSDRQRFAKMGVAGVITKPFDPMSVWKQVAEILGW
ncbi:MAG: response regulator [Pelatocladus maniniholoensis HA4357-MV3]|jgi:CheY-like chemotaxis protein|uniref:Response regulator n=1 Tax=Pelatocladus maniniholoensis HA4357-MV3 TaxID=1117104 RepID=A0A9E3LTS8_9NOST|nr:response regulator [Pelatocladus maniniholoensis HA4357-MV3]BAZ65617.1 response regulator receiver protein [Fischerella sp. NIES-4106]